MSNPPTKEGPLHPPAPVQLFPMSSSWNLYTRCAVEWGNYNRIEFKPNATAQPTLNCTVAGVMSMLRERVREGISKWEHSRENGIGCSLLPWQWKRNSCKDCCSSGKWFRGLGQINSNPCITSTSIWAGEVWRENAWGGGPPLLG